MSQRHPSPCEGSLSTPHPLRRGEDRDEREDRPRTKEPCSLRSGSLARNCAASKSSRAVCAANGKCCAAASAVESRHDGMSTRHAQGDRSDETEPVASRPPTPQIFRSHKVSSPLASAQYTAPPPGVEEARRLEAAIQTLSCETYRVTARLEQLVMQTKSIVASIQTLERTCVQNSIAIDAFLKAAETKGALSTSDAFGDARLSVEVASALPVVTARKSPSTPQTVRATPVAMVRVESNPS